MRENQYSESHTLVTAKQSHYRPAQAQSVYSAVRTESLHKTDTLRL
jgi:RPA family protein